MGPSFETNKFQISSVKLIACPVLFQFCFCLSLLFSILMDVISQPEIEMVARSLEKHLKVEQREFLLDMLNGVCGEESQRSVAEALGLVSLHFASLHFCF